MKKRNSPTQRKFLITSFLMFIISGLPLCTQLVAQLIVDTVPNPQLMLEQEFGLMMASISNLETKGNSDYWGTYIGTESNIGLDSGIVMANGDVRLALGFNDLLEVGIFDSTGLVGDADLTAIAGYETEDASILEFDFVANAETILIDFVFASEEYPEWVANEIYNDVFAIWLDGENIALLPDSQPVCVNNVNCFGSNSEFYICSDPMNEDTTPCDASFNCPTSLEETTHQYDGFTTPLTATISVTPGTTHHLKMGIADVTDNGADSAVFLKFSAPNFTSNRLLSNNNFSLKVFPNPTKGILHYQLKNTSAVKMQLINCIGQKVASFDLEPGQETIQLPTHLPKGIYFLNDLANHFSKQIMLY